MKIGILTRKDGYNFGTSLQAYALYRAIKNIERNVLVINYSEYSLKAKIRYLVLKIMGALYFPYDKARDRYDQRKLFDEFEGLLNKTNSHFRYKIPHDWNDGFDKIVCGSDQIWNPSQKTDAFLLDFTPDKVGRIAYAPSIGLADCRDKFTAKDITLFKRFSYLSCRERSGCDILSALTGLDCCEVLDPTLLLEKEDWTTIEIPISTPKRYLLTYFLGGLQNYPLKIIRRLADENNLEIINVCLPHYNDYPGLHNIRCGPREFLYLMNNATLVCTNSYHGSIFSLIFNKLFYVFERGYNVSGYNEHSRFDSLFASTPIKTIPMSITTVEELPYKQLDYVQINSTIQRKRALSISYLQKAIYD